jgi:hypothetical protein
LVRDASFSRGRLAAPVRAGRRTQLDQRAALDLSYSLGGEAVLVSDLTQRLRRPVETKAGSHDRALARGQHVG